MNMQPAQTRVVRLMVRIVPVDMDVQPWRLNDRFSKRQDREY